MKILYFQGFSAFNGCKPILTITEERTTRKEPYTGDEYLCGGWPQKMPGVNAGVRVLSDAGVCCWFICKRGGADLQNRGFPFGYNAYFVSIWKECGA